jgi:hypothetical protein
MRLSELPVWIRKTSEEAKMNLVIVKWLLAHRDLLTKILESVKGWNKDLPLEQHWEIVDKVARLVIPVLTRRDVYAMLDSPYEDTVSSFALGAEANALGVDWVTLVQVIIPILQAILQAFSGEDD